MKQVLISRTLRDELAVSRIASILSQEQFDSRRAVGRRICEEFSFVDPSGRLQLAGCMKALAGLAERDPRITLPVPQATTVRNTPRLLEAPVALPRSVPRRLSRIDRLSIHRVEAPAERMIWNTLIAHEHPHGLTIFAGRQMRYLIGSGHGWLGAAGFAAAALRVAARDRYIGWDETTRQEHLQRVVGLSRFLIRPSVQCPHLASRTLGLILRRLPHDMEARYHYRPFLVESFADEGYDGICLRAANFLRLGITAGRGRQDRDKRYAAGTKTVFLYPMERSWRRKIGGCVADHVPAPLAPVLAPGEGLNAAQWAANEFGGAPLGDKRLSARLVKSAALLASHPGQKINASADADTTAIAAFYRLIEMPVESAVTSEAILAPHRERSIQRMRSQHTVLAIQDGTDLNFSRRPGCDGLQIIGRNQTAARVLGLHLHATLAVNENGLPLGVLRLGFDDVSDGTRRSAKTERWLDAFADTARAAGEVSRRTRVIAVCDREGDFFALFDEQRRRSRVELLVRARHDRVLGRGCETLFAVMSGGEADGRIDVEIDGLTARPKASGRQDRPARLKRLAGCELRFRRVTLPPTERAGDAAPITLSAVHIRETAPPEGEAPVQWYLLTTLKVDRPLLAAEVVGFYLQRWRVEDYFRVLKSGCGAEHLLFRSAERLQRAIAINSVIAWRIMVMTLLGRQVPDCDPELMFTDDELHFLRDYAYEKGLPPPDRLGDAVYLVADLGGYQGRKHDSEPGNQIMWHGQTRLTSSALGHRIGFRAGQRYALQQS